MTSINDLLSNLTDQNPISPRDRPETWRLHFIVPGAARLWRDDAPLLRALVEEGFEVHVIAHDDGVFDEMHASGIRTCALPACDEIVRGVLLIPALYPIIQGYLIEHPPTLVHVEQEPLLTLTAWACTKLDEPPLLVGTLRGLPAPWSHLARFMPAPISAPLAYLEEVYWAHLGRTLDIFLTVTRAELEHLMGSTPIPSKKLEVWVAASGYDHTHFDPARRDLPTREELRVMAEVPDAWSICVGVAGDLSHDAERLANIIQATMKRAPEVGWVLARIPGQPTPDALQSLDAQLLWLEPGEHGMPLFLSLADLYFSPRLDERPQGALIEAAAMGTPVVACDTRFASSIVLDGQTGSLLPANASPAQIADVICALAHDSARRERLAEQARTRAINKFTRVAAHDQLMRLYDRLLSRRYSR